MIKNFKSEIVSSVIAITIATAGITTVSSFTLISEAQAWSLKSAAGKVYKSAKKTKKNLNRIHDKIVPSELRYPTRKVKKGFNKIRKWNPNPAAIPNRHDHRKSGSNPRVTRR